MRTKNQETRILRGMERTMKISPMAIAKPMGYSLSLAALCSLVIMPPAAIANDAAGGTDDGNSTDEAQTASGARTYDAPVASEKSETVYLYANANGSITSTEVKATLKNPHSEALLADTSTLVDIKASDNGDYYTGMSDNMVWNAQGEDVHYTGATSQQSPVSMTLRFYLDGRELPADQVAGATGKLTIRCDYHNTTDTAGQSATGYVPFTFITAMLFDSSNFKNVETVNAKLIDDNDRTIVAGFAIPGLTQNLGSIAEDMDIPDYFEVTADVTDFEMNQSLTIATAGLFENFKTDSLNAGEMSDASSALTNAIDQILEGTTELKEGLDKLAEGAESAQDGSEQIADGADEIADGASLTGEAVGTPDDEAADETLIGGMNALKTGHDTQLIPAIAEIIQAINSFASESENQLALTKEALENMQGAFETLQQSAETLASLDQSNLYALYAQLNDIQTKLASAQSSIDKASTMLDNLGKLDYSETETAFMTMAESMGSLSTDIQSAGTSTASAAEDMANGTSLSADAQASTSEAGQAIESVLASMTAEEQEKYGATLQAALADAQNASSDLTALDAQIGSASENLQASATSLQAAQDDLTTSGQAMLTAATTLQTMKDSLPSAEDIAEINALLDSAKESLSTENIAAMNQNLNALSGLLNALNSDELNESLAVLNQYYPVLMESLENANTEQSMKELQAALEAILAGMQQESEGMAAEREGLISLGTGLDSLTEGARLLASSLHTYADGMSELSDGTSEAAEGAESLAEGIQQFKDEGISEVAEYFDEMASFSNRLDAVTNSAKNYTNFSGITEGTSGSVSFIIQTDAIENE